MQEEVKLVLCTQCPQRPTPVPCTQQALNKYLLVLVTCPGWKVLKAEWHTSKSPGLVCVPVLQRTAYINYKSVTEASSRHLSICKTRCKCFDGVASASNTEGETPLLLLNHRPSRRPVRGFLKTLSIHIQDSRFCFEGWQWPHFFLTKCIDTHHVCSF